MKNENSTVRETKQKNHPNWSWCCRCAVNTLTLTIFIYFLSLFYITLSTDWIRTCLVFAVYLLHFSASATTLTSSFTVFWALVRWKSVRFIMMMTTMTMAIFFFLLCHLKKFHLNFSATVWYEYPNYVVYNPLLCQSMSIVSFASDIWNETKEKRKN